MGRRLVNVLRPAGSRRDDSEFLFLLVLEDKPRHGQPSPPPSASLRVIQAKGVQRLPAAGSEGTHRCLGAMPWSPRAAHPPPSH